MVSACMQARAASNHISVIERRQVRRNLTRDFSENQVDVYTLDEQDLTTLWIAHQDARNVPKSDIKDRYKQLTGDTLLLASASFEIVREHGATAATIGLDGQKLGVLAQDFRRSGNVLGAYDISRHANGRQHISFKGNHKLRSYLRGTRYRLTNPTVVNMGIGQTGLSNAARGAVYITAIISASLNGLQWVFDENFGWSNFTRNVSSDLVVAAIAAAAGYFASIVVARTVKKAVVIGGVGFGVGIFVGQGLNLIAPDTGDRLIQNMVDRYELWNRVAEAPGNHLAVGARELRGRANDLVYCSVSAVGETVVTSAERAVQNRVRELLRRITSVPSW